MTTATRATPRITGALVLVRTAAVAVAVGAVLVLAGGLSGGSPAAWGALVGAVLTTVVFAFGAFSVNAVAALMPGASLLVAMLTYTLQLIVLAVALLALSRSGLLGEELSRGWVATGLIGTCFVWLAGQLVLATRARIPAYRLDGPDAGAGAEASTQ